jgi:outer membrane protein TolC
MGGKITATNRMADLAEQISETKIQAKEHDVIYEVENAYWMVVSLKQKKDLADSYVSLVAKLDSDVHKMIDNGVATRADGLKVDVALNEAEMTQTRVDNGLVLAKMYLCQLCGMDLHSDIMLEDQELDDADRAPSPNYDSEEAYANRPELKMLSDAIEVSKQQTKIARSGYLPQLALTGGILFTNPSMFNGFQRRFEGVWNVGVMLKVPVLDWGGTMYRIRAAKHSATISQLTYDEAREKIDLQLSQCSFRMSEANKNLITAQNNITNAEENLRCATVGFREGVISTTDVMAAQTAWLHARTSEIDAKINVKLSETALKKAQGLL